MVLPSGEPAENRTLFDLSLSCIKNNFDRFLREFDSGQSVPKKHFEALHLLVGKELRTLYGSTDYFLKYMDFFLNPYLSEIDLNCVNDGNNYNSIADRFKVIGKDLKLLKLSGFDYSTDVVRKIVLGLSNIKYLYLYDTNITHEMLRHVTKSCTALEALHLRGSNVTDYDIEWLCPVEDDGSVCKNFSIKTIDLNNTPVSAVGVAFILKNFPNLVEFHSEKLIDAFCILHMEDFKKSVVPPLKTYKLQSVTVANRNHPLTNDAQELCVLLCPNLRKLMVDKVCSQSEMDAYGMFTGLTYVSFNLSSISISFSPFILSTGHSLKTIELSNGVVSAQSLLRFCPKLDTLVLKSMHFERLQKELELQLPEHEFQTMKHFCFDSTDFLSETTMESLHFILSLSPKLETLRIYHVKFITLRFVNSLFGNTCMSALKEIDVSYLYIDVNAANQFMVAAPNLNKLTLRCRDHQREAIEPLQQLWPHVKIDLKTDLSAKSTFPDTEMFYLF